MMQSIFRILKFAIQNFFRNFWLSLATLVVIVILLFLVNLVVGINYVKDSMLSAIDQKIDISLFFKESVSETDVIQIKRELEQKNTVESVAVISPDEGLASLKAKYPDIGEKILPALNKNPLGFTLRIKARQLSDYQSILDDVQKTYSTKLDNPPAFNDSRTFTAQAASISDKINIGAVSLASIFFLIAIIIIFNTIRVSIYTHRDEISIMKLVGATNWFVRMPFIVESILYSLLATILTIILVYATLQFIQPSISRFLAGLTDVDLLSYYRENFIIFFGWQFILIALLNVVSTTFALRRYLKI